jgi:hypothetical protein
MAKYLDNMVKGGQRKLKRLIKPTLGFKSMRTSYATIKDVEIKRMLRKRQFDCVLESSLLCWPLLQIQAVEAEQDVLYHHSDAATKFLVFS